MGARRAPIVAELAEGIGGSALTIVGDGRRYNPVTDMLEALPAWDGGERVGYLMQSFLGAEESEYVTEVAEILGSSFPGWVQSPGKRRFGSFGPQRAFVKTYGN